MAIDLCSDGSLVASVGADVTVRIWNANTGEQIHLLLGHTDPTVAVSFSPDCKYVASSSYDGTLRIWDVGTGQQVHILESPVTARSLTFSPDGAYLLAEADRWAQVWNTKNWQQSYKLTLDYLEKALFSPNGHFIRIIGGRMATILNTSTGLPFREIEVGWGSAAFSSDSRCLVTSSSDGTIHLWDVKTGRILLSLDGPTDQVDVVVFGLNDTRVVSAGRDKTIRIRSVETGQQLFCLEGHGKTVHPVFNFANIEQVLNIGDNKICLCDLTTAKELHVWDISSHERRGSGTGAGIRAVKVAPDVVS